MTIYALLLYGIPLICIAMTLYVGYLGFRFYLDEVVRGGDRQPTKKPPTKYER